MSEDYLFDPGAAPDPQVQQLERALRPFRLGETAPPAIDERAPSRPGAIGWRGWLAAAGVVAAAALALLARRGERWPSVSFGAEHVALAGAEGPVRIDAPTPLQGGAERPLRPGDRIVCEEGGRARLRVGEIGWLTLEERTRVRVVAGLAAPGDVEEEGAYRLDLERGTVSARIFAAPRVFWLGTPSGIAVDLGCVYSTTVDDAGHATLAVKRGRVSFESEGRRVYVPAGASCRAWPGYGPGTPAWIDASEDVRAAAVRHDEARIRGDAAAARRAVEELLVDEDERDTLTLWHLLAVPEPDLRQDVFERLREFCPPPRGVSRDLLLSADPGALSTWLDALEDSCW
jgi:hypothetical protein